MTIFITVYFSECSKAKHYPEMRFFCVGSINHCFRFLWISVLYCLLLHIMPISFTKKCPITKMSSARKMEFSQMPETFNANKNLGLANLDQKHHVFLYTSFFFLIREIVNSWFFCIIHYHCYVAFLLMKHYSFS